MYEAYLRWRATRGGEVLYESSYRAPALNQLDVAEEAEGSDIYATGVARELALIKGGGADIQGARLTCSRGVTHRPDLSGAHDHDYEFETLIWELSSLEDGTATATAAEVSDARAYCTEVSV